MGAAVTHAGRRHNPGGTRTGRASVAGVSSSERLHQTDAELPHPNCQSTMASRQSCVITRPLWAGILHAAPHSFMHCVRSWPSPAVIRCRFRYFGPSRAVPVAHPANARSHCTIAAAMTAPDQPPPMHSRPDLPNPSALLPCQLDSYARSGSATILACEGVSAPSKPAKGGKAAAKSSAKAAADPVGTGDGSEQGRRWVVTLDGGPLYAEGGGQPSDMGSLRVIRDEAPSSVGAAGNGASSVAATGADGGSGTESSGSVTAEAEAAQPHASPSAAAMTTVNVLSVARGGDGAVLATIDAPLPAGARVAVEVDWQRRFDLMQQHTGNPDSDPTPIA